MFLSWILFWVFFWFPILTLWLLYLLEFAVIKLVIAEIHHVFYLDCYLSLTKNSLKNRTGQKFNKN